MFRLFSTYGIKIYVLKYRNSKKKLLFLVFVDLMCSYNEKKNSNFNEFFTFSTLSTLIIFHQPYRLHAKFLYQLNINNCFVSSDLIRSQIYDP